MRVFVIGIAGGVGRRLAKALIARGDAAIGPVRRQEQVDQLAHQGVPSIEGDILAMSVEELAHSMRGSDAVVFTAGAGGKGGPAATSAIDGDGPGKLTEAARLAGVRRFLLVSVFPEAWRDRETSNSFEHYIVQKKKADINLAKSNLDWVILRPAALMDGPGTGAVDLGLAQIHGEITRDDLAATIVELLHEPAIDHAILEVTGGKTAIATAVGEMAKAIQDRSTVRA